MKTTINIAITSGSRRFHSGLRLQLESRQHPPAAGTVPTIAALAPSSMTAGGPAFVLTVNGTNFSSTATINWNGTAQTTSHCKREPTDRDHSRLRPSRLPATVTITVTNPATAGTGMYGSWRHAGGNFDCHEFHGQLNRRAACLAVLKPPPVAASRLGRGHRLPALPAPPRHIPRFAR